MDATQQIAIAVSQHLGKLFYAIASSDKKIKKVEVEALKKEISTSNINDHINSSNFKIDVQHHITGTFDILYFEDADAQTCFDDFIIFKKKYESLFTNSFKNKILEIVGKIAASFSYLNKSELMMLAKLSIEFKKTPS